MKVPMVRVGVVGRQVEVGGSVLATGAAPAPDPAPAPALAPAAAPAPAPSPDGGGRLLPVVVKVEPGDSAPRKRPR